jgi:hypothetical protein
MRVDLPIKLTSKMPYLYEKAKPNIKPALGIEA